MAVLDKPRSYLNLNLDLSLDPFELWHLAPTGSFPIVVFLATVWTSTFAIIRIL